MSNKNIRDRAISIAVKLGFVILVIIGLILIKVLGGAIGGSVAESYLNSNKQDMDNQAQAIEILSESISDIKKDLPITVDEITTLEKIDLIGLNIIYEYKLELVGLSTNERETIGFEVKNENTKVACENTDVVKALKMGVSYQYNYRDLDGLEVPGFKVTQDICNNFQYTPLPL